MLLAMKTRKQKLVRFDPSIVTVKQSSIVSQIVQKQLRTNYRFGGRIHNLNDQGRELVSCLGLL